MKTLQTGDIRLIKSINDKIVLNLIRERRIISAAELAQITGMRPSTISNIIKDLLSKSLITNLGKGESTDKGGKKPFLWTLNHQAAYVAGIDLEIGQITAVILNLGGEIVAKNTFKVKIANTLEEWIGQIKEAFQAILESSKADREKIIGMGIAIAGVVNSEHGIVRITDVLPQLDLPLADALKKIFPFPVMIENNANAAAIGAKWAGRGVGRKNFITILLEIDKNVGGMGIGLVLSGELYHGACYCSGELNIHLPTLRAALGTLRNRFSEGLILQNYAQSFDEVNMNIMIDAARQGDKVALLYFSILGHLIGKCIASTVALINPEMVILAGDVAELNDIIVSPVRQVIDNEILNLASQCLTIETSMHGRYSVAIGAASLILNDFFKLPIVNTRQLVNL